MEIPQFASPLLKKLKATPLEERTPVPWCRYHHDIEQVRGQVDAWIRTDESAHDLLKGLPGQVLALTGDWHSRMPSIQSLAPTEPCNYSTIPPTATSATLSTPKYKFQGAGPTVGESNSSRPERFKVTLPTLTSAVSNAATLPPLLIDP